MTVCFALFAALVAPSSRGAVICAAPLSDTPTPSDTPTLTPTPSDTPTLTPTPSDAPTLTPNILIVVTLQPSGNELVIERRITFGDIAIVLVVVGFAALYSLRWLYEMARREVA